ncbi:hypothetical protein KI387_011392, partial [Taxus chinensis]
EREERRLKYNEMREKEIDRQRRITSGLWSQTWWKGVKVHAEDVELKHPVVSHP